MTTQYFALFHGEELVYGDKEYVMREIRMHVDMYICDHRKHNLPLQVTEEEIRNLDVRLYALEPEGDVFPTLPIQEWYDQWYAERVQHKKEEEEREYQLFLELKAKYEGTDG